MPRFCGIVGCGSRADRDKKSLFRLPAELSKGSNEKKELSRIRRQRWLNVIKRADLTETKKKYLWICEDHFISRKPADLSEMNNPDWIPSRNMGYDTNISSEKMARYDRFKKRRKIPGSEFEQDIMETCVAIGCNNRTCTRVPGISFYYFPTDEVRRLQWIRAVRRANWQPTRASVLCSQHFTDDCFDRKSPCKLLKRHSVPTIFKGFPTYLQQAKETKSGSSSEEVLSNNLNEPSVRFNDYPISIIESLKSKNITPVKVTDLPVPLVDGHVNLSDAPSVRLNDNPICIIESSNCSNNSPVNVTDISVNLSDGTTLDDKSSDKALLQSKLRIIKEENKIYREKIEILYKKILMNEKTIENLHQLISAL